MDNTAQAEAPITNQDTLNAALAPVEEQPKAETKEETKQAEGLYLGKYSSVDELQKAYTHLQARATKAEQTLKEFEQAQKKAKLEQVKSLGYDEQVQFLVDQLSELQGQNQELRGLITQSTEEATAQSDAQKMEAFISSRPELIESGMDQIFRELAQNPAYSQYTFESIYESRFEPSIKKLMGTKVTVRERPLKGESATVSAPVDLSKMSNQDYEKHRAKILKEAGIN